MILYHDPDVNDVMNYVYFVNESIDDSSKITFGEKHEEEQVQEFIEESQYAYKFTLNQSLMMSITWVLPCERELFPEVITADCTYDTTNEARSLLTMAGKDSIGKIIIIMHVFLPNERSWVFR